MKALLLHLLFDTEYEYQCSSSCRTIIHVLRSGAMTSDGQIFTILVIFDPFYLPLPLGKNKFSKT